MNGRQIYQNTKSCRQVQLSSGVAARVTVSTTSSSAYPGDRAQVGLPSFGYRAHVGPPPAAAAHILDTEYRYDRHLGYRTQVYGRHFGYRAQVWLPSLGYKAQVWPPSLGCKAQVWPPSFGYKAQVGPPSWIRSTGMAAILDTEHRYGRRLGYRAQVRAAILDTV